MNKKLQNQATIAIMNEIISKTNSKLILITPTLNWVDLSILDEIVKFAEVQIILDGDFLQEEDITILNEYRLKIKTKKIDKNRLKRDLAEIIIFRDDDESYYVKFLDFHFSDNIHVTSHEKFLEFRSSYGHYITMPLWDFTVSNKTGKGIIDKILGLILGQKRSN
ncbi:MAG: hypothetical protein INQ03_05810 [Candidatus Heimdallarchaeota archaeon]|nr:hypothetical protein [Candidatus Heimdallarchaeota archaeon]